MKRLSDILGVPADATVTALLGPTNTGKTHHAILRMLGHRTGMIGLPLRLLAREVYDRVVAARGVAEVALVTGEEKRIPASPRYWVCTVEAMPLDVAVDFLCVDEIQLAGDRRRGHVFTDRILHARGRTETLFLGASTIEPLLRRLVPRLIVDGQPRLSSLAYAGCRKVTSLPPRSAVVAFSAAHVYEIAERLKARRGGTAVVLGALSPRTRNAQVELFQSGEVQHLVATDAIGMGLNLDVDHVAFAALRKFDGRGVRALDAAEVAQIAGRAGRWRRDGSFGGTGAVGAIDPEVVEAVESHRFPPLPVLFWRNVDLDFRSVDALRATLLQGPPAPFLVPMRHADDETSLEQLAVRDDVRALARDEERVRLLWEVAQVPDFRKTLTNSHVELLAQVYRFLTEPDGHLPTDWVARRIDRLDRTQGEIDALMTRIAWIRTWNYVSFRPGWVRDRVALQEQTRDIEDRLSDALHAQLTLRFVERRPTVVITGAPVRGRLPVTPGEGGLSAALQEALDGVELRLSPGEVVAVTPRPVVDAEEGRFVDLQAEALIIDRDGLVRHDDLELGRLVAGPDLLSPRVVPSGADLLPHRALQRLRVRLEEARDRWVEHVLAPLRPPDGCSPRVRSVMEALCGGLGNVSRRRIRGPLTEADREALARLGVRVGAEHAWSAPMLEPRRIEARALLWSLYQGRSPLLAAPAAAAPSVARDPALPGAFYAAVGYRVTGPRVVRVDVLDRVLVRLRGTRGSVEPPPELVAWLGCRRDDVPGVLGALGFASGAQGR